MILSIILWIVLWIIPLTAVCYLVYYGFSLPLRRQERARLFLDLLETGLKQGKSPEQTIISVSQCREPEVGVQFHLLAAHLEKGLRLTEALQQVPKLLPPQITAMLTAGVELGNLGKVLPACRKVLTDGSSQMQSALNYLVVIAFTVTPIIPLVGGYFMVVVLPKFVMIFNDMGVVLPFFLSMLIRYSWWFFGVLVAGVLVVYLAAFIYLGGPAATMWLRRRWGGMGDRFILLLPWRGKRLLRDYSAMLAVLLDAAVPEAQAITLAAGCTNNSVFKKLALNVVEDLKQGVKLTEAVAHLDQVGEFRWRLANASQGKIGFLQALSGWHDALEARAFQLEQAAAQGVTTGLVLLNGLLVGTLVVAIYQTLIAIINEGVLW